MFMMMIWRMAMVWAGRVGRPDLVARLVNVVLSHGVVPHSRILR
jgi:hypothetical protein